VNPEKWERMKQLFASALDLPPQARREFLRNACGTDDSLFEEVEALIATHESEQSTSSGLAPPVRTPITRWDGQRIGPYRILHRIGSGGMGDVYLAVRADDAFNKRVAIKLVQTGIDTKEILDRFRHERRILAALEHPNIARLLDGGTTDDGLPYFVMDFVEGTPIDEYSNRRRLSISERIALFRKVCLAVHYVHQNLVVHRDLKPSNILVTADGVPKLLDFGIAKLLKPEFLGYSLDATRIEFRLMTPWYASPEQIRGEAVTTASDVYSLGVILYELLTSRCPYRPKTNAADEVLRAVCEQEPERPSLAVCQSKPLESVNQTTPPLSPAAIAEQRSTVLEKLKRQLAGDLDMIAMKALRKEPERRYPSAEQLSEDLRRQSEALPVTAQRDSTRYRAGKFVRRHKAGVVAAGLVLVSLVAGVLATTWQARVARAERAEAERQFNDVRKLTTSFLFEFDTAIQNLPGSTPARQLLVERALEYLHKLAQQARSDPGLQLELAEAYLKVGDVQGNPYVGNLGDTQGAVESYQKALAISQSLTRANPEDRISREYLARSYLSLGEVLPTLGKPTEGLADLRQATEILTSLANAHPADQQLRFRLANSYQALGDLQGHSGIPNLGDPAGSLASYRTALDLYQSILLTDAENLRARHGAAILEIRIGDLEQGDDPESAMKNYRSSLATFEELSAADPNNVEDRRRLGLAYQKVGAIEESLGNNRQALENYQKVSALSDARLRGDPNNAQAKMSVVVAHRYVGDLLYKMNDRSEAIVNYRQSLEMLARLSASEPNNVLTKGRYSEMLIVMGQALAETGKQSEAQELTARGLSLAKQLAVRDDATPEELFDYAQSFLTCEPVALRQPQTAVEYLNRALEKSGNAGSDYLDLLAQAYFQAGDIDRAVENEEKALGSLRPAASSQAAASKRTLEARLSKFRSAQKHQ
jgi:eukaryotic-like serine/threonine-protein kinase